MFNGVGMCYYYCIDLLKNMHVWVSQQSMIEEKKVQHIWGNTCITLNDIELQILNQARHDDHNP